MSLFKLSLKDEKALLLEKAERIKLKMQQAKSEKQKTDLLLKYHDKLNEANNLWKVRLFGGQRR